MLYFRFFKTSITFCIALFLRQMPFAVAQDIPVSAEIPAATESEVTADGIEPLKITVDVQEVRLDAVVLDWRGRPITDLTADDFEVYQDNRKMKVTSSVYIDYQASAAERSSASQKASPYLPKISTEPLESEEVRRTILFVVDNISMEYQHLYFAKMGINRFLESQMQPNDLVSIMHTGPGNSALNVFSSDKRQVAARADAIPWDGVEEDAACTRNLHRMYASQISALSFSIRALKEMPGRKTIFFMTSCTTVANEFDIFTVETDDGIRVIDNTKRPMSEYVEYVKRFDRLADDAMDAGVVVHSINARGLEYYDTPQKEQRAAREKSNHLNPLPVKTGGLRIEDSNFFFDGIGTEANNMIAGYYLISYVPPPYTFEYINRGQPFYRRLRVNVKGRFANVYTRHGFWSRQESKTDSASSAHPLQSAIFSPFRHTDLSANMLSGYVKDAKADYLVRSWIHVDPKDVAIVETEDGGARIALKIICVTSDAAGVIHDARLEQYIYNIEVEKKSETIAWIQKHGIRFSMLLPVKKPGFYTVRLGLQDMESGKLGSAWQLVEIPDLTKKPMALSSVFMIVNNEDLAWMNADVTKELSEGLFFPTISEANVRTPALRTYMPGDELRTLTMLYNVDAKVAARNEIEVQTVLYKDGREYLRGEARPITADEAKNPGGVQILRKLTMGGDMLPGDYVLQVLVIDKAVRAKEEKPKGIFSKIFGKYIGDTFIDYNAKAKGVASETLSFRVVADFN